VQFFKEREFLYTRGTPGSPEIDDVNFIGWFAQNLFKLIEFDDCCLRESDLAGQDKEDGGQCKFLHNQLNVSLKNRFVLVRLREQKNLKVQVVISFMNLPQKDFHKFRHLSTLPYYYHLIDR
jgi:hypothetical protein